MKVKTNLNETKLIEIANSLDLKLYNFAKVGNWYQFTLKPIGNKFKAISALSRRKIWACCLHGYSSFMAMVLTKDPKAKFKTMMADVTIKNIIPTYITLCDKNVGSIIHLMTYGAKCLCSNSEYNLLDDLFDQIKQSLKFIPGGQI